MPYIEPKDRKILDPLIDQLAEQIVVEAKKSEHEAAFTGLLNYSSTRLALKVLRIRFGKIRYWLIAAVVGTFHNVADEFYRRLGIPYEDRMIERNGDVDLYAEFVADIEKKQ
jgi:hypothetical protein